MFSLIKLDVQFLKRKSVEQQKNNVHFPLVGSLNHIYIYSLLPNMRIEFSQQYYHTILRPACIPEEN